jgi:hypothetical protein
MLKKVPKVVRVIGISAIALTITSAVYLRVAIAGKDTAIDPCFKTLKAASGDRKIAQVASATDHSKQTDYVVFTVGDIDKAGYWEPLVSVNSGVCRILNANREDEDHPVSEFVSKEIAEKLTTLVLIKKIEKSGGKKAFEASLAAAAKNSKKALLMPVENYDSLKKIGIKIPDNIKPFNGIPTPKQLEEERH